MEMVEILTYMYTTLTNPKIKYIELENIIDKINDEIVIQNIIELDEDFILLYKKYIEELIVKVCKKNKNKDNKENIIIDISMIINETLLYSEDFTNNNWKLTIYNAFYYVIIQETYKTIKELDEIDNEYNIYEAKKIFRECFKDILNDIFKKEI